MNLGAFSVSLAVKDLAASKAFYEKLGFEVFHGQEDQNWLIMKNHEHVIGLFHGMFENNIMTFNPGWDQSGQATGASPDIREIQKTLRSQGIEFQTEADESTSGPASFVITDPDGNAILVDQHV